MIKESCQRHKNPSQERQAYFFESPVDPGGVTCNFFEYNGVKIYIRSNERQRTLYRRK